MNQKIKNSIEILQYAIKNNISAKKASFALGKGKSYVSDTLRFLDRNIKNGSVSKEEAKQFKELHNKYLNKKNTASAPRPVKPLIQGSLLPSDFDFTNLLSQDPQDTELQLTPEELLEVQYDAETDDNYDERSLGEAIRENGKISQYHYKILVKNQEPLEGYFSREEMDRVYRLYSNLDGAGLTLRGVSREFPNLTFRDFKRIIRAFNIVKQSVPVAPHILEEKTEDEIVQLIIRNKENLVFKKLENERNGLIEKYLLDAQRKIVKYQQTEEWVDKIIEKYFSRDKTETTKQQTVFKQRDTEKTSNPSICIFGDVHFGKKFDNPVFGRAYNKEIAHERIMQIANCVVEDFNTRNPEKIIMICAGDLIESAMPEGMHSGHLYEMDLFQEDQIFFAVDSINKMMDFILTNTTCPIEFHAISGNHDRAGEQRTDDKNRTFGKIICKILERELTNKWEKIKFNIPKNNLLRIVSGKTLIFAQHGDSSLFKKKPNELMTLYGEPGCYSLFISAHFHRLKVEEGTNFISMTIPSVASADAFILEELGNNNLPGFILGNESYNYGFDYKKITLY